VQNKKISAETFCKRIYAKKRKIAFKKNQTSFEKKISRRNNSAKKFVQKKLALS
jgi:hypothetical protein